METGNKDDNEKLSFEEARRIARAPFTTRVIASSCSYGGTAVVEDWPYGIKRRWWTPGSYNYRMKEFARQADNYVG